MAKENRNLVVGLDIGTSKVAALVAELGPDGVLEVLGMGSHDSKGLKKGVVVNIESTVAAIQRDYKQEFGNDLSAEDAQLYSEGAPLTVKKTIT